MIMIMIVIVAISMEIIFGVVTELIKKLLFIRISSN